MEKEYATSSGATKHTTSEAHSSAPCLERWARYFRHRYSKKKNYLKITWIQRWLNLTNALWKNLKLYQLNLILNSNQGLALFRQKQMLRSNRHKNLQKQNNEDFFVQLLNAWLHFTNNKFLISTHAEEVLDQPIFWNLLTGLNFNSNNSYFTISHTKLFTDKFTIIS